MVILRKDREGYASICKDIPLPAAGDNSGSSGLVVSIVRALRLPLPQDRQRCCSLPPSHPRQFESRLEKAISNNFRLWWCCIPSAYEWALSHPERFMPLWSAEFSSNPQVKEFHSVMYFEFPIARSVSSRGLRTPKVERSKNQRVLLSLGPLKRIHRPTVFKCYTAGATYFSIQQSISKPC